MWYEIDDPATESTETPPLHLDQSESLIHLRLGIRGAEMQLTLYVHHSLADGHHGFSLIEEMFSYYTDLVGSGSIRPVTVQPAPAPLEVVLAERGIQKLPRTGLERFVPAMFAYDLPPSRRAAIRCQTRVAAACSHDGLPADRARDTRPHRVQSVPISLA